MKVQHTATLDFTDNGVFETGWRIKQGDYGNTELVLRLVNNGVNVYDAAITPQIAFRKWDGASVISVMTPNDQTYKYAFAGNELEVPGLTLCDVKFTDAEGRVSTASCRFTVVEDTIGYDPTGAHTYDNPVSELVEQATNAAEVGIESSFKAEGFAVGEQGGVPVGPDSPYYENNAKWWAQQAGDPIGTAVKERTTTTGQFTTKTGGKLESCVINLEPIQSGSGTPSPSNVRPITGHTAVELGNVGKNRLQTVNTTRTVNGITYTVLDDGSFIVNRVEASSNLSYFVITNSSNSLDTTQTTPFKSGMTIYPTSGINGFPLRFRYSNGDFGVFSENTAITLTNDIVAIYVQIESNLQPSNFHFYPMIRVDGDNTWQPYNPSSKQYTVALGQTVYGGSLEAVSRVLTVDKGFAKVSDLTWTTQSSDYAKFIAGINNLKYGNELETVKSDIYKSYSNNNKPKFVNGCYVGLTNNTATIKVYDEDYPNESDLISWKSARANNVFCYDLATPIKIQLTPQQINTLIGENHLDVPLEGQSLDSAVYRELFAWDDVNDVVDTRLPISAIGTDESNNDNASQAYSQGDYFYKNGIAKAKTSIAQGATFTLGTNYENKTLAEILETIESAL